MDLQKLCVGVVLSCCISKFLIYLFSKVFMIRNVGESRYRMAILSAVHLKDKGCNRNQVSYSREREKEKGFRKGEANRIKGRRIYEKKS